MKRIIVVLLLLSISFWVHAEEPHPRGIQLDGTIGNAGNLSLPGPNYEIKADYGKQAGTNLFHSFHQFNLHSDESATFSGPNSIQNIISRVTGGNSSWIDGKLSSTIPNANLYLLNPSGVLFGPNVSLDLTGSFHVSTSDYLRLGDNDKFFAEPLENEVLSVASPTAFGFLGDDIAPIIFEGGEVTAIDENGQFNGLSVTEGKSISVIGGDIEIRKGLSFQRAQIDEYGNPVFEIMVDEYGDPVLDENGNLILALDENGNPIPVLETITLANLAAPEGEISIVSIASEGEAYLQNQLTANSQQPTATNNGNITLSDKALLDVSGDGAGSVFIRGGKFVANDSYINALTLGEKDGDKVDIQADSLSFTKGASIDLTTYGTGKGGNVTLIASEEIEFTGENSNAWGSMIQIASTYQGNDAGDAGNLLIESDNISFADGAYINSATSGTGKGGNITLRASDTVRFAGEDSTGWGSMIQMISGYEGEGAGDAGSILIEAENISFTEGAYLASTTFGRGQGGDITLRASESVNFSGKRSNGTGSSLEMMTEYKDEGAGDGGSLLIEAKNISFEDGAYITGITLGKGRAGSITLRAEERLTLIGKGEILGEDFSSISANVYEESTGGDGNDIFLEGEDILLSNGAEIVTSTASSGNAGNISIKADKTVTITGTDSKACPSRLYAGSKSTGANSGAGGEISVSAQTLTLSNHGEISSSSAGGGKSGKININVNHLHLDEDAFISSESQFENTYTFANIQERDARILILGDRVQVTDVGNGKIGTDINTGDKLVRFNSTYAVANFTELYALNSHYDILEGDVAEVADAGDGNPGRFIFAYEPDYQLEDWIRFDEINIIDVPDMTEIYQNKKWFSPGGDIPYSSGNVIKVADAGDGKLAVFVYIQLVNPYIGGYVWGEAVRLSCFNVENRMALNSVTEQYSLKNSDIATITDTDNETGSRFIFQEGEWIKFNNVHVVANIEEKDNLVIIQAGNLVKVEDAGNGNPESFIYSGNELITLNNTHVIANMTARDQLSVHQGDVVYVSDADGAGNPANFLYNNGEWITFVKGDADTITINSDTVTMSDNSIISTSTEGHGNAADISLTANHLELDGYSLISSASHSEDFGGDTGNIEINISDSIRLTGESSLTTEAKDAAGGNMNINAGNLFYLHNSEITTSVDGGDGKGGDIRIYAAPEYQGNLDTPNRTQFVILNHSKIKANAYEGDGGNIHIVAEQFIQSSDSFVEASSEKGIDGEINIDSPDTDITSGLTVLPENYLDVSRWMQTPCYKRLGETVSRFVIKESDGVPAPLDGCLGSPPILSFPDDKEYKNEAK